MQMREQVSLQPFNTFGVPAVARWFSAVEREQDLAEALDFAGSRDLPLLLLGGGSNIVLTSDWPGLALHVCIPGRETFAQETDSVDLRIGAGENWHQLVLHSLAEKLCGLENLSLIPGNVGAAPIQNIGAYGVELQSCFLRLEAIDLRDGSAVELDHHACGFGYRDSLFKREGRDRYLITRVWLRLAREPQLRLDYGDILAELDRMNIDDPGPSDVSRAVIQLRSAKLPDPSEIGNAGSFFKNPVVSAECFESILATDPDAIGYPQESGSVKLAAGWLIQQCGWKGYADGPAGVHSRQALVLVNRGGATGSDILDLAGRIQRSVRDRFGVNLEIEPRVY